MDIDSITVPKLVFPVLLLRHSNMSKNSSEISQSIQLHEFYLYLFYKNFTFNFSSSLCVNSINGTVYANTKISSLNLKETVNFDFYFNFLLNSPLPFIFAPNGKIVELQSFCNGCFYFRDNENEGILMNLSFASEVGLNFLAFEFLKGKNIHSVYIGLYAPINQAPN